MADVDWKDRARFRSIEVVLLVGLLVFGITVGTLGALWSYKHNHPELQKAFIAATVTLFFGSILGGVVSLLLQDFDRRRIQRAAERQYISNVLADLKNIYDSVDRGRTLIVAHQSAKTYGDEMRAFIEAQVKLRNVERALRFDDRSKLIASVHADVTRMESYLRTLTAEFEKEYKEISRLQNVYEARMKQAVEKSAVAGNEAVKLPQNSPWIRLQELKRLQDFLLPVSHGSEMASIPSSEYESQFLASLDRASGKLRIALDRETR